MIETLSLAAEITVGVLLISLAWDRASCSVASGSESEHNTQTPPIEFTPVRELYDQCLAISAQLIDTTSDANGWKSSAFASAMAKTSQQCFAQLESHMLDPKTHFPNHLAWEAWLERELLTGALAVLDVDAFVAFNEAHTMEQGDRLLDTWIQTIHQRLAWVAKIYRLPGGRIACLAPGLNTKQLQSLLEHELSLEWKQDDHVTPVTLSGCITDPQHLRDPRGWITIVDEGIAAAKFAGTGKLAWFDNGSWQTAAAKPRAFVATPVLSDPTSDEEPVATQASTQSNEATREADKEPLPDQSMAVSTIDKSSLPPSVESTTPTDTLEPTTATAGDTPGSSSLEAPDKDLTKKNPMDSSGESATPTTAVHETPPNREIVEESKSAETSTAERVQSQPSLEIERSEGEESKIRESTPKAGLAMAPEELGELASSDDIQALFAQMKATSPKAPPAVHSNPVEATPAVETPQTEVVVATSNTESEAPKDVSAATPLEAGPADVQAEVEIPPAASIYSEEQAKRGITAEDIESLLGNVEAMSGDLQRSMKHSDNSLVLDLPESLQAQASEANASQTMTTPKGLEEIVNESNKTEKASKDDISALFAAMRK